jgi:hypothetical protein
MRACVKRLAAAADGHNVLCGLVADLLVSCVYSCSDDVTVGFVNETVRALSAARVRWLPARRRCGHVRPTTTRVITAPPRARSKI